MHEDRQDQPGLEQHEEDDERPAHDPLHMHIIDHVGHGAQHEEIAPDLQVQADGVMLAFMG